MTVSDGFFFEMGRLLLGLAYTGGIFLLIFIVAIIRVWLDRRDEKRQYKKYL